jgi:hypothetical protein
MAVTTVAQFAAQLNRQPTALLEQLQSAGVSKKSPEDALTEADKERSARIPAHIARHLRRRRAQEDHADAQVDQRDQAGRRQRQGAHDPGGGAQEACLRQA